MVCPRTTVSPSWLLDLRIVISGGVTSMVDVSQIVLVSSLTLSSLAATHPTLVSSELIGASLVGSLSYSTWWTPVARVPTVQVSFWPSTENPADGSAVPVLYSTPLGSVSVTTTSWAGPFETVTVRV